MSTRSLFMLYVLLLFRGYLERKRYLAVRNAVLAIQAHYRAAKVRHWVMKVGGIRNAKMRLAMMNF